MKICLFCRHFYPHIGGNETQTMNLALRLIEKGHTVMVVTGRIDESYPEQEKYQGIQIYRAKLYPLRKLNQFRKKLTQSKKTTNTTNPTIDVNTSSKSSGIFRTTISKFKKLYWYLTEWAFYYNAYRIMYQHRNEFDIIHSQMLRNYGYMALKIGQKLNKPVLIKNASLERFEYVDLIPFPSFKRELLRKKGNFATISTQIEELFKEQGVSPNRIFKVFNGIDTSNINSKNNHNCTPNTILYVGNYWQGDVKGLDVIIKAMGEVVKQHPEAILKIAGKGDQLMYEELAKANNCLSNISFLGQVKDIGKEYSSSAIFVLPSRREGMSNAILEAMSYGMPCVVTDVSGARDQIENKIEGLIVPIDAYKELADAICFMLENPDKAKLMGDAAKEKIKHYFDASIITDKILEIYYQLILKQ